MLCPGKVNVWRRQRYDLDVDPYSIHIFDTKRRIGHRRRDTEEARTTVGDDRIAGLAGTKREVGAELFDEIEVLVGVEVCVQIELLSVEFWTNA